MKGLLIEKPVILSSSSEKFNSLTKVKSFNMAFDEVIFQKISHKIMTNHSFPIFLMIQYISNRDKNPNIFIKIEEKPKNKLEVSVFLENSQENQKDCISQFVEKYLYYLLE